MGPFHAPLGCLGGSNAWDLIVLCVFVLGTAIALQGPFCKVRKSQPRLTLDEILKQFMPILLLPVLTASWWYIQETFFQVHSQKSLIALTGGLTFLNMYVRLSYCSLLKLPFPLMDATILPLAGGPLVASITYFWDIPKVHLYQAAYLVVAICGLTVRLLYSGYHIATAISEYLNLNIILPNPPKPSRNRRTTKIR